MFDDLRSGALGKFPKDRLHLMFNLGLTGKDNSSEKKKIAVVKCRGKYELGNHERTGVFGLASCGEY